MIVEDSSIPFELTWMSWLDPLQDDGNFNPDDEDEDGDDGDPYYIMIPKADELMPKECIFDRLERAEADKWVIALATCSCLVP